MSERPSVDWPRYVAALILLMGFSATLIVNYPGHFEFDSIRQLIEGQRGLYSNWHPPVMSWLLGVADAIEHGGALFVVLDAAMAFGAVVSLLWLMQKPSWFAVPAAVSCVALPQLFLFQAIVWKDILFADSCLVGFILLSHAAAHWKLRVWRFALIAASSIFMVLAVLTRQNGAVILPCAAVALGVITAQRTSWRPGLLYATAFLFSCTALTLGANAALQSRATKALGATEQIEDLQLYDIGGMLHRRGDLKLVVLEQESPALAQLLRRRGARLYTPVGHDRLTDDPGIRSHIISSVSVVGRQWFALLLSYPGTYLAVRAQDFGWLFLSEHPDQCLTYAVGVIGPAADLKAAGLKWRYDDRDRWLDESYAAPLVRTLILSHPLFAVIGLICMVVCMTRRRPADIAITGLVMATMLYALSYFVIAISCQYRYLYPLDLSAIAAGFYCIASFGSSWAESLRRTSPEGETVSIPK